MRIHAQRRWVQLASLLALHSSWGPQAKWLCNPVLSCHSCALAWFACPIGVFVHSAGYQTFIPLAFGAVLLAGALFGRLLCGWVCPFGYLQDMLHKIPSHKIALPDWTACIKYGVVIVFVFAIPYMQGESTVWSFCRGCPAATLQVSAPYLISSGFSDISVATAVRWGIFFAVVGLAIVSFRSFCKVFCPIGAILAPLNYVSYWVMGRPRESCLECSKCDRACGLGVKPAARILKNIPVNRALECIVCYECKDACAGLNDKLAEAAARRAQASPPQKRQGRTRLIATTRSGLRRRMPRRGA